MSTIPELSKPLLKEVPMPANLVDDTMEHNSEMASKAFLRDPFQCYFTSTYLNIPSDRTPTVEDHKQLFDTLMPAFLQSGTRLVTVPEETSLTSIWKILNIPGNDDDDNSDAVDKHDHDYDMPHAPMELHRVSDPVWRSEFPNQQILHLVLMGNAATATKPHSPRTSMSESAAANTTEPSSDQNPKPKGASYILKSMCEHAKSLSLPVVLESSSPKSRDVYLKCGFQVIKAVHACVGKSNAQGRPQEGGEGLTFYLMKYV